MSLFTAFLVFGLGGGLLVVGIMAALERTRRRTQHLAGMVGAAGGGNAIAHQGNDVETEGDTAVMRPTFGLRVLSLGFSAVALMMIWGPFANTASHKMLLAGLISAVIAYFALYVAIYEVRYDEDGLHVPGPFGKKRTYDWINFDMLEADGSLTLKLRFHNPAGDTSRLRRSAYVTVPMQKYLVGMPAFLTFLAEIKALNSRI